MNDMNFGVNILPTNNSFTLGNSTKQWDGSYIDKLDASNISQGIISSERLPTATTTDLGTIKIMESTGSSTQTYGVVLDSDSLAYVGIPWTDTKVTMTNDSNNIDYPILLKPNNTTVETTDGIYFNKEGLTYNPFTNVLKGASGGSVDFSYFTGNAATADAALSAHTAQLTHTASLAHTATVANRANITPTPYGLTYYSTSSGHFASMNSTGTTADVLLSKGEGAAPEWGQISSSHISGTIPNNKLENSSISIGTANASLGGAFNISDVVEALSLNKALTYRGIGSFFPSASNGDVYILTADYTINYTTYHPGVYVYNGTTWDMLGSNVTYKIAQESFSVGDSTNTTTAINFIKSLAQDGNGNVAVTTANLPLATTSTFGIVKVGSGLAVSDGELSANLHSTITVEIGNTTASIPTEGQWYLDDGHYCYDMSSNFVTTDPPTDVNVNVLSGRTNILKEITVSTDIPHTVRLTSLAVPSGTVNLKISLDKVTT